MRLLVDTQALIWFVVNNQRLSDPARGAMRDPGNSLLISPATFWEMGVKVSVGKLRLPIPFPDFIRQSLVGYRIELDPILPHHAEVVATMPFHHKDPFDRMIAAQALAGGFTLVSADPIFDQYAVPRLW